MTLRYAMINSSVEESAELFLDSGRKVNAQVATVAMVLTASLEPVLINLRWLIALKFLKSSLNSVPLPFIVLNKLRNMFCG